MNMASSVAENESGMLMEQQHGFPVVVSVKEVSFLSIYKSKSFIHFLYILLPLQDIKFISVCKKREAFTAILSVIA